MMSFWKAKDRCPITEDDKQWLEDALLWFEEELGREFMFNQETFTPTKKHFNWSFKGTEEDAQFVLERVSEIMSIDRRRVKLLFYSEPNQIEFSEGLSTVQGDYMSTTGKYIQYGDGEVEILIEEKQLKKPMSLIATMAHELAHVKLFGEGMIDENDEYLTDLAVLVYGFGIFNANTAIVKMNTWLGVSHTGWQMAGGEGYLHYKVQAFALALLANYKKEQSQEWLNFLEKEVYKVFKNSLLFIEKNPDQIKFK